MKKILLILLSVSLLIAFTGCGATTDDDNQIVTTNAGEEQTTTGEKNTSNIDEDETTVSEEETSSKEEVTSKEDATSQVETTSKEEATSKEETTTKAPGKYSDYDTTMMEYGVGTRRLPDGRYEGPIYCANLYKGYNVEFTKENEKVIYLTFDEGYENGYTPKILDTLKEKNVKAVFFLTMDFVKSEPQLVQRMIDEGHVLGNHTVSHPSMPELSPENQIKELMDLHNYIKSNYGYDMYLYRPPMGKISKQSVAIATDCGYTTVLWSFAYLDYNTSKQPTKEEALEIMTSRLHNGGLYLLHAVSSANTAALGDFIDYARAQGYTFVEYLKK